MANVENLYNSNGDLMYPLTHQKAVIDDSGNPLDSVLTSINENIGNISERVDSLSDDIESASSDISNLEASIDVEVTRAKAAEQALGTEITEAENRVDERVTEVRDNLEAEVQDRNVAVADLNANTGISEYPAFDPAEAYAVGDVVNYEGRLKRFTEEHAAGEWIGTDVESWSERKDFQNDIAKRALFDIEQGTVDNKTRLFEPSSTRVRTTHFISTKDITRITVSNGILLYRYVYDREGKFIGGYGWTSTFTLEQDRLYLLVFKKGDTVTGEPIIVNDVWGNIEIEYAKPTTDIVNDKFYSEIISLPNNIELKNLFVKNWYINTVSGYYQPNKATVSTNLSYLVLPVFTGDSFIINNITGGSNGRAYTVFSKDGTIIEQADANAKITEKEVSIAQDGWIVFNAYHTSLLSVTAITAHITTQWANAYISGIFGNTELKIHGSIPSQIDLTPYFRKGAYINVVDKYYKPESAGKDNSLSCISIKVKEGDIFEANNIVGSPSKGRAYATYDVNGQQLYVAEPSAILNETITIEQDGYIVFNAINIGEYSLHGTFNFFEDWNWPYLRNIMTDILPSLDDSIIENRDSIKILDNIVQYKEEQSYPIEKSAATFQTNTTRKVYNTKHIWKDGDVITNVLLSTKANNSNNTPTSLLIYDRNNILKTSYELGVFNSDGEVSVDVSNLAIVLKEGDKVALKHCWYASAPGNTDYYDISSDTVTTGYIYCFGFKYIRNTETIKDKIKSLEMSVYGDYEESVSSDWNEGYINVTASSININTPVTTYEGWYHKVVECKEGDKFNLIYIKAGTSQGRAYTFLDADMQVLLQSDLSTYNNETIIAPANTKYLVLNANISDAVVSWGNKPVWEKGENDEKEIKILCFGNSFTQDSMSYVPAILKNIAPDLKLTIAIAYIGGCPLAQHLANFINEDVSVGSTTYDPTTYTLYKSRYGEAWKGTGGRYVDDILSEEDWDIITFQQSGGSAYKEWETYYAPYIYKLHASLFSKLGKAIKLGWLLTQGAYANSDEDFVNKWQGTADNSKKIMELTGTSVLFPFGTAVQNLRSTSLKTLGDGTYKNLAADSGHLQEGIGCLTAAYTNALTILKLAGYEYVGIIGEGTRPSAEFVEEINVPGPNLGETGVIGITEFNCYMAQVAAECAIKSPYAVTNMEAVESAQ